MCSIRCIKSSIYIWRRTSLGLFVIENMGTPALCARKKKFLFHSGLCLETAEMCHLFQTRYIFTPKSNKCVLISMHSWVNSCKAQNFFLSTRACHVNRKCMEGSAKSDKLCFRKWQGWKQICPCTQNIHIAWTCCEMRLTF